MEGHSREEFERRVSFVDGASVPTYCPICAEGGSSCTSVRRLQTNNKRDLLFLCNNWHVWGADGKRGANFAFRFFSRLNRHKNTRHRVRRCATSVTQCSPETCQWWHVFRRNLTKLKSRDVNSRARLQNCLMLNATRGAQRSHARCCEKGLARAAMRVHSRTGNNNRVCIRVDKKTFIMAMWVS